MLLYKHFKLNKKRLSLPSLPVGFEPNPGVYSIYTPGYYILGLHFRRYIVFIPKINICLLKLILMCRVPLGFEPLSAELNTEKVIFYSFLFIYFSLLNKKLICLKLFGITLKSLQRKPNFLRNAGKK